MIRAVILDFNGVLVDDELVHFQLFRDLLGEFGITLTEAQYQSEYLGYDDRQCFEAALSRHDRAGSPSNIDVLIRRKAQRYADWAKHALRVFPHAEDMVIALAEQCPLAICSGALRSEIDFALDLLGISGLIETIIAAEDTERCKPDPEGYYLALDALRASGCVGLEAGHCLVVEDSLAGIRAAKSAGMWAVGVTHSYNEAELRSAGADAVIDDLAVLDPSWIKRFFHPEITP